MTHEVRAEMVANVWKVTASAGESIGEGATICILESMKMEIPVEAPLAVTLTEIRVGEGGAVQEGDVIAVIEPA